MRQLGISQESEEQSDSYLNEPIQNILHAIEIIVQLSENSKLSKEFFEKAKGHIDYAGKMLKLTPVQTVLFSIFIDRYNDRYIHNNDLARHLGCQSVRILRYSNEIDELEKRRLIRCVRQRDEITYRVAPQVIDALKENRNYTPPSLKNLNIQNFFFALSDIFEQVDNEEITYQMMEDELNELFQDNAHLEFVRKINNYQLSQYFHVLLIYFCHLYINESDNSFSSYDIEKLFSRKTTANSIAMTLSNGDNDLFANKLLEFENSDSFADRNRYCLTRFAIKELFSELNLSKKNSITVKSMLSFSNISSKKMYYNQQENCQINQLTELLKEDRFKEIQQRLAENGMRKGFACLFYGAPGTGKTETVLQLARETGRNIIQVNVSEIKSMWVGESEKNIKELFDDYRQAVKESDTAPILLFNEADAVLGIRQEGANRAVDKMENSIQNIILQEMETLEGIMIATTNLTQNLDKAFERRFLYKIKFEKPDLQAKQAIWLSMIPNLNKKSALALAQKYDFSGGQIENIARKNTVDNILTGRKTNLEKLKEYCDSETISKNRSVNSIVLPLNWTVFSLS